MARRPIHRDTLVRLLLALAALLVAGLSLLPLRELRKQHERLHRILAETGVGERREEVSRNLDREQDPERAKLVVAKALLADSLDRLARSRAPLGAELFDEHVAQLVRARDLAREALPERPAAWQAHMIVGATTYLEWSLREDGRLITEAKAWERPLQNAVELAPSYGEARRFLTMAYLELWHVLSPEKRLLTKSMVTESFEDPTLVRRLLGPWFDVATDLDEAFALLPDRSFVWSQAQSVLAQRGEWRRYVEARRRWRQAQRREAEAAIAEAELRLRGGDLEGGQKLLHQALTAIPPRKQNIALLVRAMELLPPGLLDRGPTQHLRSWLDWSLERCRLRDCSLPGSTVSRLAGNAGGLPLAVRAEAALAALDPGLAEQYEASAGTLTDEDWAPYLVQKVVRLVSQNELARADERLAMVHPGWRSTPVYLLAVRDLAIAMADRSLLDAVERRLARESRSSWPSARWRQRSPGHFQLTAMLGREARGFELSFTAVPAAGACVELIVDGALVRTFALQPRAESIRLPLDLAAGLHSFEIVAAAGKVVPGSLSLLASPR